MIGLLVAILGFIILLLAILYLNWYDEGLNLQRFLILGLPAAGKTSLLRKTATLPFAAE